MSEKPYQPETPGSEVEDAPGGRDADLVPAALRDPKYRRMADKIVDADSTSAMGAAAIGIIEGGLWERCQQVPTRAMLLKAARCQSYVEVLELEDRFVAEILQERKTNSGNDPKPATPFQKKTPLR